MRYNLFMGIDPGKSGGCVVLSENAVVDVFKLTDVPTDLLDSLKDFTGKSIFCVLEKVSSRPYNGAKSNFTFGYLYGMLNVALAMYHIPHEKCTPQKWMKYYSLKKGKSESDTEWKHRLRKKAVELFPDQKVYLWNADAFLIAHYCREQFG